MAGELVDSDTDEEDAMPRVQRGAGARPASVGSVGRLIARSLLMFACMSCVMVAGGGLPPESFGSGLIAAAAGGEVRTAAHVLPPGWPDGVPLTAAESMAAGAREEATEA